MSKRVLLADDSRAMRVFIRRVIEMSGFEVSRYLEAGDGREALEVLRGEGADLVLTDINMPVMDGETMLREIAGDAALRDIPVVVVSTDMTAPRMERLQSLGAAGYVCKPFYPEDLRATLESVMELEP